MIWCASFDIGKKNFSFYVEEFDDSSLSSLTDIPPNHRYNKDGTTTSEFQTVLDSVFKNGKRIILENVDITMNCKPGSYLDPETFYNMIDVLDRYASIWDQCHTFVIGKQMQTNPMALKLAQHCYSYFCFRYGRFKNIVEFQSYNKTQVLGAPKTEKKTKTGKTSYKCMDKPARKKWCIVKAKEIVSLREDVETVNQIEKAKKKDDLCDVICQLASWKYLTFVNKK